MGKLTFLVEEKIKTILPNFFALDFDGCTESSVRYSGVFAFYPDNHLEAGYNKVLLSFVGFTKRTYLLGHIIRRSTISFKPSERTSET